jgi:hypothetical protein
MTDTKLVKLAGEHSVCATLACFGWSAALTRDGLERTDILAVNALSGQMIEVQVKAASHSAKPNWRVNQKAQTPSRSDREWFVFVVLPEKPGSPFRSFILPREHAWAAAWIRHMDWRTDPAAPTGRRNAGVEQARVQDWVFAGYEDRWSLLDAPATEAPVLLPPGFHTLALDSRVGLPPDHPWTRKLPKW